jgi:hypothetical protein
MTRKSVLRIEGRGVELRSEKKGAAKWAELLGFEPDVKQTDLLERNIRRLILNCTRQWGKSTITAAKAVARAQERQGSLTLVVSPSARQSGEFLRKAAAIVRRMKIKARGDGDNEISLLLPNGSRLVGLPGMEATVRGFSAVSLLLIDEAARVSDDMYRAIRPMLAVGDGDLWMMSTPFGRRGFFWEAWSKGGELWERVMAPATQCPRIPASFLAEEKASLGDRWFRQEYLCEFTEADGALFSREMVERAVTDEVKPLFG